MWTSSTLRTQSTRSTSSSHPSSPTTRHSAKVKDEDLMYNATPQDLVNALTEVFNLRAEWYKAEPEPEKEEGKKGKNG